MYVELENNQINSDWIGGDIFNAVKENIENAKDCKDYCKNELGLTGFKMRRCKRDCKEGKYYSANYYLGLPEPKEKPKEEPKPKSSADETTDKKIETQKNDNTNLYLIIGGISFMFIILILLIVMLNK